MKPTHNHRIGAMVRRLRKARKLTQEQLAEASGLSRGTISNIEDALTSASIDSLSAITIGLDCDLHDLIQTK